MTIFSIMCINAYPYFGREKSYFTEKLLPHIRTRDFIYIVIPGLKEELLDEIVGTWPL